MKRFVKFEYFDIGTEQDLSFEGVAYSGGVIEDWSEQIIVDVNTMTLSEKAQKDDNKVPILWGHNHNDPAGHGFISKEDGKIFVKGKLYGKRGEELYELMKKGYPMEQSIGFYTKTKNEYALRENESKIINGYEVTYPVKILYESRLKEVSLVSLGADESAEARVFSAVKPKQGDKQMAKKTKTFADCSCQEQKDEANKLKDQISKMLEVKKDDEELLSLLKKVNEVFDVLGNLFDASEMVKIQESKVTELSAEKSNQETKIAELSSKLDEALSNLEKYTIAEKERINAEKIQKLEKAFSGISKELTDSVKDVYLSMNDKQFQTALEALETQGKSFLFNAQKTSNGVELKNDKDVWKKVSELAIEKRKENKKLSVTESHELAKKELGL